MHAPATGVAMRFVLFGLACLTSAAVWLLVEPEILTAHHYRPHTVAWAHLVVLGFILSVIAGALYQIAPVAMETKLYSARLAEFHFVAHFLGVGFMVPFFTVWDLKQVGHGGSLVFLGMLIFVGNIARTLNRAPRPDVVGAFIASSMLWLFLTMGAGLTIATNKFWPFLPGSQLNWMYAHAHLGVGGVFINLTAGVSLRLAPMFTLSEIRSAARAWWAFALVNLGVAGLFWAIVSGSPPAQRAFGGVLVVGLGVYGAELRAIFAARKRRRLDWGLWQFFFAVATLAPVAIVGLAIVSPVAFRPETLERWQTGYALLALLGVIVPAILGMLQKILPFLIWQRVYAPFIGRRPVPSLGQLSSESIQGAVFWSYLVALVALLAAAISGSNGLARGAAAIWLAVVALFLVNAGQILGHWFRPRTCLARSP
ncbi:MAG: hypothetical protein HUU04_02440 [Verrucomicrobiae bacterium]|nr:hypothetical protein [Verrucomicrobiae bacterium]